MILIDISLIYFTHDLSLISCVSVVSRLKLCSSSLMLLKWLWLMPTVESISYSMHVLIACSLYLDFINYCKAEEYPARSSKKQ